MQNLDTYDKAIIHYLGNTSTGATANELATKLKMSWITAKNHINKLEKLGYIKTAKNRGEMTIWELDY